MRCYRNHRSRYHDISSAFHIKCAEVLHYKQVFQGFLVNWVDTRQQMRAFLSNEVSGRMCDCGVDERLQILIQKSDCMNSKSHLVCRCVCVWGPHLTLVNIHMDSSLFPGDACCHWSTNQQIWQTISVEINGTHTGAKVRSQLHKHTHTNTRVHGADCSEQKPMLSGTSPLVRTLQKWLVGSFCLSWR